MLRLLAPLDTSRCADGHVKSCGAAAVPGLKVCDGLGSHYGRRASQEQPQDSTARTTADRVVGMYINALNREAASQGHPGSASCESGELASTYTPFFVEFAQVSGWPWAVFTPLAPALPQPIVSRPWSLPRYQGPSGALRERSRQGTTWAP